MIRHEKETVMPMITVQYAPLRPKAGLADAVAKAANKLSADILHKDPTITAVVVEEIDPADWFIGNRPLVQHELASFWLDIRIVEGTNSRDEKAAFIAATFAKMTELIGPLHNESYVYVNEVRGDAYGYGGLTQNERYIANKLKSGGKAAA
jgi:4-oxalocrotonate tautomerase